MIDSEEDYLYKQIYEYHREGYLPVEESVDIVICSMSKSGIGRFVVKTIHRIEESKTMKSVRKRIRTHSNFVVVLIGEIRFES